MQTEIKIKRQMSSHGIGKSTSKTKFRIPTSEDKIKMKKVLGKVNLLAEGCLNISEEEEI